MASLTLARLLVATVPLKYWRRSLGGSTGAAPLPEGESGPVAARRLASHVERADKRLPFRSKCLPQAMALAWMLRRRGIRYRLCIAVRPQQVRHGAHALHAWLEAGDAIVLGDIPGPWAILLTSEG
jgi:hypothetical protein